MANTRTYNKKAIKCYEEGRVLQQTGKLSAAERAYNKAIKINQNFIEAHNALGNLLLATGRPKAAFNAFRKALNLRPDHPMLLTNLGNALQLQGEIKQAIGWFNKAIAQDPGFAGAHNNLANALRELGRIAEAIDAYKHSIESNPDNADTYYNLGSLLVTLDEFDDAVTNFKKAIEINPRHEKAYNGLGNVFSARGETDDAIASYRKAIEIDAARTKAHNGLGNLYSDIGEMDLAMAAYRKAIEHNPQHADAHRSLALIKKFSEYDDDIQAMESLYASEGIPDEQKMYLAYGLGKAFEDIGEYEKSMAFIIEASRLKRESIDYTNGESEALFNNIKQTFSSKFFADREGMGDPDATPIFILGMPRSGTSLVEQILASHPHVFGAGELNDLPYLTRKTLVDNSNKEFPAGIEDLDSTALEELGKQYVASIRQHSGDAKYISDKLPPNFLRIGLIKAILPNAKVIHCTRDPMDNCLSLFKNYFSSPINYSYNLTELGQYYNLYVDLMAYWKDILPGFIYDLSYEDLVSDQENRIRELLDYCNLPWDDACLGFHRTRRRVRTASNAQVRRPIYKDSVKLWQRYENQLESLRSTIYG